MSEPIIQVHNFNKFFGTQHVIKDLSFEIQEGEIFAFLGPNGSGKTTTIRALLGIYRPDSGELLINGKRFGPDQAAILGYLPEERGLYVTSPVLETMIYFGQLKGLSFVEARARSLAFLKKVDLEGKEDFTINKLSSGQQQKIQLGITILNEPQLLILDEPTKGLDPLNRELLMDILFDLNRNKGTTIVFSTHQMNEAEKIAHRLLMIKDGKRALYGKLEDVKNSFGHNNVHVEFDGQLVVDRTVFDGVVQTNTAELTPAEGISPQRLLEHLVKAKVKILKFEVSNPSLDEIFIQVSKE